MNDTSVRMRWMGTALLCGVAGAGCSNSTDSGAADATDTVILDALFAPDTAETADSAVSVDDAADTSATPDTVVATGSCADMPDGTACEDGDACTEASTCLAGTCAGGTAITCKVSGRCLTASCDPALGCVESPLPDDTTCTLPCFTTALCESGVCTGVVAQACPAPTNDCVANLVCDPSSGECTAIIPKTAGAPCDRDADLCTLDTCNGTGTCAATGDVESCQDQQQSAPCQVWQCVAASGCTSTANVTNGVPCGSVRVCDDGVCVPDGCQSGCGTPLSCPTLSPGFTAPNGLEFSPTAIVGGASIHVLGGSPHKQHLVYSPGAGWTTGVALQSGVNEGAGVLIGTHWYLVDGSENEGVRIFDLEAGAWSLGAERPAAPPRGPAAGTDGAFMFVADGADGNLNAGTATHRYNPTNDTWATMAPMPTARGFIAHAVVGDRLYAFGGRNDALSGSSILRTAEAYDMSSDTWIPLSDMPTKRNSAFAAAVGDHVVVAGGFSGSNQLSTIEIYDTVNDTWQTCTTSMSTAFSGGAAAALNGTLYLFGGGAGGTGVEIGAF